MALRRASIWLALLLAGTAGLGWAWYAWDRAGMLGALCEVGLPNLSRPATIDAEELGCTILGPRVLVKGVLLTGFETSSLVRSDLPEPKVGREPTTGNTWWDYRGDGKMTKVLGEELRRPRPGICNTGMATVTAYGWPSESAGRFGHLGLYARVFYADELVNVSPPSNDLILNYAKARATIGLPSCG